ncbi:MAG: SHIRT domain-containing protein, partial [Finegoldia magna]|nr:SHIRT domain-containing protein [Finegoldia magna]
STNNYIYAIWAPIINYTTDGNGQVKEGENFVDKTKEEVELKSNPKGTETKANEGYKFSHWTADKPIKLSDGTEIKAGEKITEDQLKQAVITEPLTFTANFVKDEFKVKHEFKVAEDSPIKEMPDDVKTAVDAQLPEDKTAEDGKTTTPGERKNPTDVEDKTNDGVWKFEGFKDQDPDTTDVDAKVNGADVTFQGAWKFTPNEHNVTYEYVSGTKGVELPEALKNKAPAKVTGKVKGDTVTSPVPEGKDAEFRDETNKGTWKFESYDKDSVEITNKDENVKGTWVFTPDADVVTEYVDENGKTIAPKENGTKNKKDIEGYKFVETKTDEKGNTKHIYKKVKPTPEVVTEYVDEDGKTIAPKENGTKDKKDIEGYEFVETKTDEKGNTKHIYKKVTPPTDVVTKYVDENGNPLALEEKGKQGKKDIPAYEYVKTYTDKDGNTVHVYKLKQDPTPSVETRYVDENGNQLLPPKEGTKDPVTIEGYTIINTRTDENGNTIHIYSKNPTEDVETRYVDTEGNQILADKAGTYGPATIKGYEFVRTEKDEQGNTTHIYRKLPTPSKEVVTKFIDENGLELSNPLIGRNPSKAIPGYEIVRTETDSNGNIIYVYRKKASESEKITKFVDENGKEISKSTKGDNPKKDIDGYEFVRTEKDEKGNTKHIYKKKVTPPVTTEYKVTHEFKSGTAGKELPDEVKALLPADQTGKKDGEKVTPTQPEKTEVPVKGGKWVFKNYDKKDATIDKADEHFVGTWVFEEDKPGSQQPGSQQPGSQQPGSQPQPEEKTGTVIVKYVTEDGKLIEKVTVIKKDAKIGEEYTTEQKRFDGYEFVRMSNDSANPNGKVKKGLQYVTYVYKAKKTNTRPRTQGNNTINSSSPNKKGTLVNTGDGVNASTYAIMMLAIGGALTGIGIRKKKKEA